MSDPESAPVKGGRRVAFVAGCRTPFARAGGRLADLSVLDMGRLVARELVQRADLDVNDVEQVALGIVVPDIKALNLAREVVLGAGFPPTIEAHTVSRACASANQEIAGVAESFASGQIDVGIAGGAESLSNVPILVSKPLTRALLFNRLNRYIYVPGTFFNALAPFKILDMPVFKPLENMEHGSTASSRTSRPTFAVTRTRIGRPSR